MFHILIVDDEIFSVEAVLSAIDWTALNADGIFSAYDMETAKEIFRKNRIDVMLCDIEMPNGSGIELAAWVKENFSKTVSLFLTCHSDFQYAKEAVSLGAFEYLLKPMEYDKLQEYLSCALTEYQKRINLKSGNDKWLFHREIVEDRFWSDLLLCRFSPSSEFLLSDAAKKDIILSKDSVFLPILIEIQNYQELLASWYGNDLDFAFRNIAYELFAIKGLSISIASTSSNERVLLISHCTEESQSVLHPRDITAEIKVQLLSFSQAFQKYFHAKLSIVTGKSVPFLSLPEEYRRLKTKISAAEYLELTVSTPDLFTDTKFAGLRMKLNEWLDFIFSNHPDLLLLEFDHSFSSSFSDSIQFYDLIFHAVFVELLKRNISAYTIFSDERLQIAKDGLTPEKIRDQLNTLCLVISEKTKEFFSEDTIVDQVKTYIIQHLAGDLSRERLAGQFFINPNYLSRLFKKETDISLQDYILKERIKKAKFLLETTDLSISDVHEQSGFSHSSYFSKIFKRETGMTPQEYRRITQNH